MLAALLAAPSAAPSPHRRALQPAADTPNATCDATVSYLFLSPHAQLPLSRVWRSYFDGCPPGSFTVHMHAQDRQAGEGTAPDLPEATLIEPVAGELRFSYRMQLAMNQLYASAVEATAPNGCEPRWAQMLSDSCAPVRSCADVHAGLAAMRGVSQFEGYPIRQRRPKKKPAGWAPKVEPDGDGYKWWFQSQWSTLWMDHARLVLANEEANREAWEAVDRWPVDSHYTINMLYSLGAPFSAESGTTAVAWHLPRALTGNQEYERQQGHPLQFDCRFDETVAQQAQGRRKASTKAGRSAVRLLVGATHKLDESALDGADEDAVAARQVIRAVAGDAVVTTVPHASTLVQLPPQERSAGVDDVRYMLSHAVRCGRFFARKFTGGCEKLLIDWQQNTSVLGALADTEQGEELICNEAKMAP